MLIVKDEIIMYGPTMEDRVGGATAVDVANQFVARYRKNYMNTVVHVYGDPKGYTNVGSDRELTRYESIYNILTANDFIVNVVADKSNIPRKERIDNVNELLRKGLLVVNPLRPPQTTQEYPIGCDWTVQSLAELQCKDKVKEDAVTLGDENARRAKKRDRVYAVTHITDALGYLIYYEFNMLGNMDTPRGIHTQEKSIVEDNKGNVTTQNINSAEPEAPVNHAEAYMDQQKMTDKLIKEEIKKVENMSLGQMLKGHGWR